MPRKEKIANTYVSAILNSNGADKGNRTPTTSLGSLCSTTKLCLHMAPSVGLEPTTDRLTADCSTDWAN